MRNFGPKKILKNADLVVEGKNEVYSSVFAKIANQGNRIVKISN